LKLFQAFLYFWACYLFISTICIFRSTKNS